VFEIEMFSAESASAGATHEEVVSSNFWCEAG
jgi:hypothetical protein